jgi:Kef-type K+ transport system membrane component KefB
MVPRGEVGLIFASIGRGLGAVSDQVFSVIVIVVILTTLCTPPILTFLLRKSAA